MSIMIFNDPEIYFMFMKKTYIYIYIVFMIHVHEIYFMFNKFHDDDNNDARHQERHTNNILSLTLPVHRPVT